jgi:hypothetical protein
MPEPTQKWKSYGILSVEQNKLECLSSQFFVSKSRQEPTRVGNHTTFLYITGGELNS